MAEKSNNHIRGSLALEVPYPSKAALPVRRPAIIRRQRLIDLLSQATERRIVLVSAPAGYGKTTLLLDFAQSRSEPVCWYALDERDRDLRTFLRYLVASGQKQFPEFGSELADVLKRDIPIATEEAIDLLVAASARPETPYLLILDDFHFLDDTSSDLKETIEGWLYRMPSNCHVILSGRTQSQLGILPLMSVRQEVEKISSADFSFTCDEVVHLFRDVLGKEVTLDDAQHLADITEGWAGALVLLAERVQASRTAISLEHLRGSDMLSQYIQLEQFDPQPPDVKQFLTGSAIPRAIDIAAINELLDITDAEEKLNYLEQRNLFVLREGELGDRYRYHQLFRAFLISHLRARDSSRFVELNLKAASLMEAEEHWEEAIYHYIQAAAWDHIVAVTERVGPRLFEEGRWDTLSEWLDAVPLEDLTSQPKLLLWKARVLRYLNQVDASLGLLSGAIPIFECEKAWGDLAEALMAKGMCLRVKGDYEASKADLNRACELAQKAAPPAAAAEARRELGITLHLAGDLEAAIVELEAALAIYEGIGDRYNIAYAQDELGTVYTHLGRIGEAINNLESARVAWNKLGNEKHLVQTLNNLGFSYYLAGKYGDAEAAFEDALEKARQQSIPRAELYLLASLGDVKRDTGDYPAAIRLYRQCLDQVLGVGDSYVNIYAMDALANTYRLMGQLSDAQSWSERSLAEAQRSGALLEIGPCTLTRGLLERDEGDLRAAADSLHQAAQLLEKGNANRELTIAQFHLAGVYFSMKRKSQALETLAIVARLVEELGYDHFLTVEAARNPLLIQYAAAHKLADGYFERLLKTMKAPPPTGQEFAEEAAAESADPTAIKCFGFGNLRAEVNGREITDLEWRSEKSTEMFFFFLCNRRPLRKEEIVTALWPDLPEEKTTSAFHSNMYRLRQALYKECIAKESGRYILDPQKGFVFDVEEFQKALQQADAAPKGSPEALTLMERAIALHKGQFAADFYTEWAENLRYQLEEQFTSVLATLASAYSETGEFKRAIEICQRILEMDEFNEAAWYRLMSAYVRSGQTEAAKYSYNRYVQIISSDDMDVEDLPDFDDLVREMTGS